MTTKTSGSTSTWQCKLNRDFWCSLVLHIASNQGMKDNFFHQKYSTLVPYSLSVYATRSLNIIFNLQLNRILCWYPIVDSYPANHTLRGSYFSPMAPPFCFWNWMYLNVLAKKASAAGSDVVLSLCISVVINSIKPSIAEILISEFPFSKKYRYLRWPINWVSFSFENFQS